MNYLSQHESNGRVDRFLGLSAAGLILSSLAINLGLGRSGSYIGTPIQGLFLPDLLLIIGSILSLTQLRKIRLLPKTALIFILPFLYIIVQTILLIFKEPSSGYDYWVRDMAPFAYISLVPLIALSLASLMPQVLVIVVRWSAIVYAVPYTANYLGITPSWLYIDSASESAQLFLYREDFSGFALGIGIVAWGRWEVDIKSRSIIQGCLLAIGLVNTSIAGLITLLTLAILSIIKDWSTNRVLGTLRLLGFTLIASILLSIVSAQAAQPTQPTQTIPTVQAPTNSNTSLSSSVLPATKDLQNLFVQGTSRARISTWTDVGRYLITDLNWVFGGGPGTDSLYFACTGIRVAPEKTRQDSNGESQYLPICGVDSNEAFSTLRDPHNWLLNLWLYHGILGLLAFVVAVLVPLLTLRSQTNYWLSAFGVIGVFLVGSFGVILSAPFGLVPLTVYLAYLYGSAVQRPSRLDRESQ